MQQKTTQSEWYQALQCNPLSCVAQAMVDLCHQEVLQTSDHILSQYDLDGLIFSWLATYEHSIELGPSGKAHAPVSLILKSGSDQVAWIALQKAALPPHTSIDVLPLETKAAQSWISQRDSALHITLRPSRSARVASRSAALSLAISYANSRIGEAYFRNWRIEHIEDYSYPQQQATHWTLLGCFYQRHSRDLVAENTALLKTLPIPISASMSSLGESFVVES